MTLMAYTNDHQEHTIHTSGTWLPLPFITVVRNKSKNRLMSVKVREAIDDAWIRSLLIKLEQMIIEPQLFAATQRYLNTKYPELASERFFSSTLTETVQDTFTAMTINDVLRENNLCITTLIENTEFREMVADFFAQKYPQLGIDEEGDQARLRQKIEAALQEQIEQESFCQEEQ